MFYVASARVPGLGPADPLPKRLNQPGNKIGAADSLDAQLEHWQDVHDT